MSRLRLVSDATSGEPLVGIDLGTTHSLVSVMTEGGPRLLAGPGGSALLPSAVAVDGRGGLLVGEAALARLERAPDAGVRWFKRDMGSERTLRLGEDEVSPVELSAVILRELAAIASAELGAKVEQVVVTVPAYFREAQRAATVEAARLAGLRVVRLINEPTAAAMAHGFADRHRERTILVVDLGGGTLDVSVLDVFEGIVEIVGSGGRSRLGGEDFTDRLYEVALERAGLDGPGGTLGALLRRECERAKRALSQVEVVDLPLPAGGGDEWRDGRSFRLDRATFAELCAPLLAEVEYCIRDTLLAAGRHLQDIEELLLVGGAVRMPCLRERVEALLGRPAVEGPDPDEAVALGAALQAGLVARHEGLGEFVVTDVLTHSLGVEVSREGQDRFLSGYFLPVLHRNTTLPARAVERVYTLHAQQRVLRVAIYQGEHRQVLRNELLGEFEIQDLPVAADAEHREAVDIAFVHDLSGLLEVEARVVSSGQVARLLIERLAGRLEPTERAEAEQRLARLRVAPRELLPNRIVLERARTRYARLPPPARALLDPFLFRFEEALERQHTGDVDAARAALERALLHSRCRPEGP